ncbi:MAG TPA: glycosyltransferase [Bacteroidales bacterium]|nr:glycosyltransferase [Bacteroidales bacterium]
MKFSCGIFANIAPLYSEPLWSELANSENTDYYFFSSKKGYSSIKTIDTSKSRSLNINGTFNWYFLKNIYIKSILIYQTGAICKCLTTSYDVYIFNGEMNCISSWVAATICKIRTKPVIFWGHGLYGNETRIKKFFRILFYRIADYHLVYANRSRNLMIKAGFPENRLFTVYNSLDFHSHKKHFSETSGEDLLPIRKELFPDTFTNPVLLFFGRLTREKKVHYLVEALAMLKARGRMFNCLVIGGGEELQKIKELRDSLGLGESVYLFGENYDEAVNARFIMMADCCVSPGNVGLTAIHSLSLGTPVITHDNPGNQGPESEVIVPGITGQFFKEDDIGDLAATIDKFVTSEGGKKYGKECIDLIEKHWTPENQRIVFDEVVRLSVSSRSKFRASQNL